MKFAVSVMIFLLTAATAYGEIGFSFKHQVSVQATHLGDLVHVLGTDKQTQQRICHLLIPSHLKKGMVISHARVKHWLSQQLNIDIAQIHWVGPKQIRVEQPAWDDQTIIREKSEVIENTASSRNTCPVHQGDQITIVAKKGAIELTLPGVAHQDGRWHEIIDVENKQNQALLKAMVTGRKQVEVVE